MLQVTSTLSVDRTPILNPGCGEVRGLPPPATSLLDGAGRDPLQAAIERGQLGSVKFFLTEAGACVWPACHPIPTVLQRAQLAAMSSSA